MLQQGSVVMTQCIQYVVKIVEYECGWDSKTVEIKYFNCLSEARAFVRRFNTENNEARTPDWFMKAELVLT